MTAAGTGVEGAIVYVFDAGTAAYVGNALTGAGGAYSLALPAGTYNLWVQTNTPGYPDQAYGPDGSFENATDIPLPPDATADVALVAAPVTHTISGTVTAAGTGVEGAIVYVFDAGSAAYVGNALTGAGGAYSLVPAPGTYNLWVQTNTAGYPDQAYGPDGSLRDRHRHRPAGRRHADVVLVAAHDAAHHPGTVSSGAPAWWAPSCPCSTPWLAYVGTPPRAPAAPTAWSCPRAPTTCGSDRHCRLPRPGLRSDGSFGAPPTRETGQCAG